ncbi:MAG: GNAT family N-acetyltransferase [Pleurocapsa sp. MO_192.B19]|nr:GNAT family N-acetyltransferase [Pleurocapsa sp. MO_192.B19]
MSSFQFQVGSSELLPSCYDLWQLFIQNQIQNAGEMSDGISAYLQSQRDSGLVAKTIDGKLHIQLVYASDKDEPIGFCITSLSDDRIGEVEALYILDEYQGNNLGTKLLQTSLQWLETHKALEEKLIVAVGNEQVFSFYQKFGFYPGYSTLFRV